jgi:hypothetical protein
MIFCADVLCSTPLRAQLTPAAQSPSGANAPLDSAPPDLAFTTRGNAILNHSRRLIDSFFQQTSNVVCTETVSQTIVGRSNKPMYREESVFEYQMQSSAQTGAIRLTESREARKVAFRDPYKTLLITNGFAGMLLILHEQYESSYAFEPVSEESIDGRIALRAHFKAIAGAASPAAVQLHSQNYPLQLRGDIWIDEESGAVVQLISTLDNDLADLGLRELRSEIHYSLVQFHAPEESYWMPASAVIDVTTPKQHWRNVHRFADYRRFRATIQVDLGENQP